MSATKNHWDYVNTRDHKIQKDIQINNLKKKIIELESEIIKLKNQLFKKE